jgi:hypothetical protein
MRMRIKKCRADPYPGCLWVFFYRRNDAALYNNIDRPEYKILPNESLSGNHERDVFHTP